MEETEYSNIVEDNNISDDDSIVFEKMAYEGELPLDLNNEFDDFEKIVIKDDYNLDELSISNYINDTNLRLTKEVPEKKLYVNNSNVSHTQEIPERKSVIKYIDREAYLKQYNIPTKKEVGDIYEIYILNYLIEEKKYKAWLWNDIPKEVFIQANLLNEDDYKTYVTEARKKNKNGKKENPLQDIGIDILAKDTEDKFIFVQCKNFASAFCFSTNLTGFYMFLAYHIDKKGILFHTGGLNVNIQKYIRNDDRIKYILKPFDLIEHRKICKNIPNLDNIINNKIKKTLPKDDILWNNNLEKLQNYINLNNKLPSVKNTYDETILHKWYSKQQKLYESYDYKWTDKWKEFLNKNKLQSNFDKYNTNIDSILTKYKNDPEKVKIILPYYNFK